MCEILVCVRNRGLSPSDVKAGDVIEVKPDGWPWGDAELGRPIPGNPHGKHDFFRVIKLPDVSELEASNLLAPEPRNILMPEQIVQHRARHLDHNKLHPVKDKKLKDYLDDDARTNAVVTLNYTIDDLNTLISVRDPVKGN